MIQKLLHRFMRPRHYWRHIGFDELSELYTSQLLRSLAISSVGIFTPLYLYKLGYSLSDIAFYHVGWFMLRPIYDLLSGYIIARIGPKHSMLLAAFIHIIYLTFILTLEDFQWPIFAVGMIGSLAYGLHLLAVHVNFSKIKHGEHGGKELGYMVVVERIGAVIGPLVGGLVANFFDPRYTIGIAMLALLGSTIPLFLSNEAVQVNQHISFKDLPVRRRIFDFIVTVPITLENTVSIIVWPLFIGVFVLGDNTFAKLGLIVALSTLSSIVLGRAMGGLIDKEKGGQLLKLGVFLNAGLHISRLFTGSVGVAAAINVANEPITAAYRMPLLKGIFDAADTLPGYRIAYLTALSIIDSISRLVFWIAVWVAVGHFNERNVLLSTFILAAVCSMGILLQRFEALRPKKLIL